MEKLEALLDSLDTAALLSRRPPSDYNLFALASQDKMPTLEHFFGLLNSLEQITTINTTTY
jgi:hypothetical protein